MLDIFGNEVVDIINQKEWEKEWQGMPEYKNEELDVLNIVVHFKTFEDVEKFSKLINQKITKKTKSIWFPSVFEKFSKRFISTNKDK